MNTSSKMPTASGLPPGVPGDYRRAVPEDGPVKYPFHYGLVHTEKVLELLRRIHGFLEAETPLRVVNRRTGAAVDAAAEPDPEADVAPGGLRLVCYEMGLTCAAMLAVSEVTEDIRFREYAFSRIGFITDMAPYFESVLKANPARSRSNCALYPVLRPETLDDAGSMATAMIKALKAGIEAPVRPLTDRLMAHIRHVQHRLPDDTLARNRPHPNTLWLDDLFMSVPALAHYGVLTGDDTCFDDAAWQVKQYAGRMFDTASGIYAHGWFEQQPHPRFFWGRANGWALLAKIELLGSLPTSHPGRDAIRDLICAHARGIARLQSPQGLWHQLMDRNDTYLETSSSAMFVYGMARAINEGWLDARSYGPTVLAGWGALTRRVNKQGQVEGTCVGTGVALDPVFYHHRPTSVLAAHGYGTVLLAGAEVLRLNASGGVGLNDASIHCGQTPQTEHPTEHPTG